MHRAPVVEVGEPPMRQADAPSTPKRDVQPASQKSPESAEPTSPRCRGTLCYICKKVQIIRPCTRCTPCDTVYHRVLHCKDFLDQRSIDTWDKLEKHKKIEFWRSAKDVFGGDLRVMLQTFVDAMQASSFSGTGEFFALSDLAEMYKHKPSLLNYIQANTRTRVCPTGGATLYEDMQYTGGAKRERDDLAEETIRLFKKQKAAETKEISEKQRIISNEKLQRKIDDWLEFLKTSQEALETCEADIKDLGRFIPPVTSERLKDIQDMLKAAEGHCDAIKDSGECRQALREFLNTMAEFKKAFNEKKAAIDTQVKTAENLKNILCRGQPGCATGAKPVKGCRGVGVTPDLAEI